MYICHIKLKEKLHVEEERQWLSGPNPMFVFPWLSLNGSEHPGCRMPRIRSALSAPAVGNLLLKRQQVL